MASKTATSGEFRIIFSRTAKSKKANPVCGWLLSLVAGALLLLAVMPILPMQYLWMWKATIAVTEYGQWFAPFCAVLALLSLYRSRWMSALVLMVSFVLYASPSFDLLNGFDRWRSQMHEAFGDVAGSPIREPSLWDLWIGSAGLSRSFEDYTYGEADGVPLRMEFFRAKSVGKNHPWVLVVPGGSWQEADPHLFWELNSHLRDQGISVAAISYRVLPKSHWPDPQTDILRAVDYLKVHADKLEIDPDNWVILGRSAGGQIAESIAFEKVPQGLKGGIFFYAPADLSFAYKYSKSDDMLATTFLLRNYVGIAKDFPLETDKTFPLRLDAGLEGSFDLASPYHFVKEGSVPTLLFHAPRDPLVWNIQSERLLKKLNQNHVPATLIAIPWGTHGFDYNYAGPGGQLSTYAIEYFLRKVLSP